MSAASNLKWVREDSEAEFCSFFDLAPIGLAQCRRPGVLTAVNPALEKIIDGQRNLQDPLRLSDLVDPRTRAHAERLLADLFDGKCESFEIDSQSSGQRDALRWSVWRISNSNGSADTALVLAREPSGRPCFDEHLQQTARLESLGRLAGGVAHDFNNILTGMLLYCDLLMAGLEPTHRSRKYAEEIRQAGMQASALVGQLLNLSRPTNLAPRPLLLNEVAQRIRDLLLRLIGDNIQLTFRFDPKLGLVKLDATQAQQILLNLVLNARDAMPRGGHVVVETRNCKLQALTETRLGKSAGPCLSCAQLVVEDSGCGMDSFTREHLFEPFFTTKQGKGTGLGLATVKDIVNSNGGLIHVSSEPDRGTRVSVFLPLVPGSTSESADNNNFHPRENGEILSSEEEE